MQSVKVNILRMIYATASANWMIHAMACAFRTRSIRGLFLPDAECQGKSPPDDVYHSICQLDNVRHGVCLLDEEFQGIFPS